MLRIQPADPAHADAYTELCMRSKASWGYDAAFLDRCRPALQLTSDDVCAWYTRVAIVENQLVGISAVARLQTPSNDEAELERLFVEPSHLGRGIGAALFQDATAWLASKSCRTLWILSDPEAEMFYLRFGAVRVGLRDSDAIAGRKLPWLRVAL